MSFQDLLETCIIAQKEGGDLVYRAAQISAYIDQVRIPYHYRAKLIRPLEIFALSVEGKREEVEGWIESVRQLAENQIYLAEEGQALSSTLAQIDFLRDFFAEDLEDELCRLTGVKRATAARWIKGGNTAGYRRQQIRTLARTFYALRHEQGWDNKEALAWYRGGSPAPEDLLHTYNGHVMSRELRDLLAAVGFREY